MTIAVDLGCKATKQTNGSVHETLVLNASVSSKDSEESMRRLARARFKQASLCKIQGLFKDF